MNKAQKAFEKENIPQPTYIAHLFDRVNGGDDCDAASEAQEIAEQLLEALHAALFYVPLKTKTRIAADAIIERAKGQ